MGEFGLRQGMGGIEWIVCFDQFFYGKYAMCLVLVGPISVGCRMIGTSPIGGDICPVSMDQGVL